MAAYNILGWAASACAATIMPGQHASEHPRTVAEMHFFAEHASAAYTRGDDCHIEPMASFDKLKYLGWHVVEAQSSSHHQTMVRDGRAVVAFRGTEMANTRDLKANFWSGIGRAELLDLFQQALDAAQEALQAYGQGNVVFTGHSLGAALANHVAWTAGAKAVCFSNPHFKGFQSSSKRHPSAQVTHFVVSGDAIAGGTAGGKVFQVAQSVHSSPHALANFMGDSYCPMFQLRQGHDSLAAYCSHTLGIVGTIPNSIISEPEKFRLFAYGLSDVAAANRALRRLRGYMHQPAAASRTASRKGVAVKQEFNVKEEITLVSQRWKRNSNINGGRSGQPACWAVLALCGLGRANAVHPDDIPLVYHV